MTLYWMCPQMNSDPNERIKMYQFKNEKQSRRSVNASFHTIENHNNTYMDISQEGPENPYVSKKQRNHRDFEIDF